MKIILTEAQGYIVIDALEWAQNPEFGVSDPYNKMYQRVIDKIRKEINKGDKEK